MTIKYNVTGPQRKELVAAMAEILEVKPRYLGMPSAAYEVDYFTIDKEGTVTFDDRADSDEVELLLERLAEAGFACEMESAKETSNTEEESIGLTITLPLEKVSVGKLTQILEAKGNLIKAALGIDKLPFELSEEAISFPWFSELPDADTTAAYTHFITALCKMSVEQKRITATEKELENEKYAFRCFLLRLGFIGSEFKAERKILLKNLSGSSAFKGGAKHEISE